MADPLDKQLVEAVLSSRPRRTKRELEEAKLATMRPRRAGTSAAPVSADPEADLDDDDDDEDLDLSADENAALMRCQDIDQAIGFVLRGLWTRGLRA